ncbi:hypothetical protein EVC11_035 [Rhizobium phage RHph_I20]|uniref:Uncharacterized protein n=1 Tax=Rhizobium phage RHph_I20 TaxID=2509730 RepID=A0A7S5RBR0_9CAUD|nr:hypothetical protein EVC11_035 [Rhizobium phage RHph_I20]
MNTVYLLVSVAVVIFAAGYLAISRLVSARETGAVLEHKVKETEANAKAIKAAASEVAKHVDRADTVGALRDGLF